MTTLDLPMGLVSALETRSCVLFVGAGAGYNFVRADGSLAPDAGMLGDRLASRFGIDLSGEPADLAAVAELVERRRGRTSLEAALAEELDGFEPDDAFRRLIGRGWKAIYTTNYDNMIERCFELEPEPRQYPVSVSVTSDLVSATTPDEVPIYHLHGYMLSAAENRRLIVTESDYTRYDDRRQMLFNLFKAQYATDTVVYVGYSHNDANWRSVTAAMRREFAPSAPPPAYRVSPATPTLRREVLAGQGLQTIEADIAGFALALDDVAVPGLDGMPPPTYPLDLAPLAERQPIAVRRLLQSWDYVPAVNFSTAPNTQAFFRGAPPSWSLVGNGVNFERDIEKQLLMRLRLGPPRWVVGLAG